MKRLLICTIIRNQRLNLDRWWNQIVGLHNEIGQEWEISLSVVENDSNDGTVDWLNDLRKGWDSVADKSAFKQLWMTTETLGTQQYGSIWSEYRLRNLASARQKCLDQVGDALQTFDKIAYVESDVTYDPSWASELILANHPRAAGIEPDIYSGWSLRSESNPKESVFLYDTCATRATKNDVTWDIGENGGKWRGESLVRTDLGGVNGNCLHRVWSTFNCFCVYRAKPFADGLKWGWVNTRLNTGQARIEDGDNGSGSLDADTAIMCERFRAAGYSEVLLNTNCLIRHL